MLLGLLGRKSLAEDLVRGLLGRELVVGAVLLGLVGRKALAEDLATGLISPVAKTGKSGFRSTHELEKV